MDRPTGWRGTCATRSRGAWVCPWTSYPRSRCRRTDRSAGTHASRTTRRTAARSEARHGECRASLPWCAWRRGPWRRPPRSTPGADHPRPRGGRSERSRYRMVSTPRYSACSLRYSPIADGGEQAAGDDLGVALPAQFGAQRLASGPAGSAGAALPEAAHSVPRFTHFDLRLFVVAD
jgi:hypothetical protein